VDDAARNLHGIRCVSEKEKKEERIAVRFPQLYVSCEDGVKLRERDTRGISGYTVHVLCTSAYKRHEMRVCREIPKRESLATRATSFRNSGMRNHRDAFYQNTSRMTIRYISQDKMRYINKK